LVASYGFIDSSSTEGRNASYPTLYPLPFSNDAKIVYTHIFTTQGLSLLGEFKWDKKVVIVLGKFGVNYSKYEE
jgi:hypothetical protein